MRKMMVLAGFTVAALGNAGCDVEQPSSFIEGVLFNEGPDCTVNSNDRTFVPTALLDIGNDAATAHSLVLPVKVRTNLPSTFTTQDLTQDESRSPNYPNYGQVDNNIITFTESEVFFTTDADSAQGPALQNEGTPVNDATVRVSGVSGVAFNEQTTLLTESVVFTTAITAQDAALLQDEPFVNEALIAQNPNGAIANRARVIVNLRLAGITTGGASVRTPPFPFPVELCAGCLTTVPNCGTVDHDDDPATPEITVEPIANDAVCGIGQDEPLFICP